MIKYLNKQSFHWRKNTLNLSCFGCIAAGQHVNGCFLLVLCNIYNRFVNVCIVKTCDRIVMSMFPFGKSKVVTAFGFFIFIVIFNCMCSNRSMNPDCSMTGAEHTPTSLSGWQLFRSCVSIFPWLNYVC